MSTRFKVILIAGLATAFVVPFVATDSASAKVSSIRGFHHSGGGAGILFGGVSDDGGGFRIKKGHLIKVPPWDPGMRAGAVRFYGYR